MINQKEIDLLVYGHIYEWVKPKVWNKNLNDIDWKNYDHFTKIFNDVANDFIADSDVNVFDYGV